MIKMLLVVGGLIAVVRAVGLKPTLDSSCLRHMPQIVQFGGWVTISNTVSPLLVWVDRVAIGANVSMSGVATYAVPFSLAARLLVLPSSLMRSLYPAISSGFASLDRRAWELSLRWTRYMAICVVPAGVFMVCLGPLLLTVWVGRNIAEEAKLVLQVLTIGMVVNSLAFSPLNLLQATGRPDLPAKFHVGELVVYVPLVWIATLRFGVLGAAAAWTLRVTLDAILLFLSADSAAGPERKYEDLRRIAVVLGFGVLAACGALLLSGSAGGSRGVLLNGSVAVVSNCRAWSWAQFARALQDPSSVSGSLAPISQVPDGCGDPSRVASRHDARSLGRDCELAL
jgi:O-antigen/teichoic acid export membrane protein